MRTVIIEENLAASPGALHAKLRHALGFPAYYGGNLPALADCLEDVCEPTRLVVRRDSGAARKPWLDAFCRVMRRCAAENPLLELALSDPDAKPADWKGDSMETLELDLTADATRQALRDALFGLLGAGESGRMAATVAPLGSSGAHFHDLAEVKAAIRSQPVSERVKEDACAVYQVLAEAEASVHGCDVSETHFHEVGEAEAVANVLSVCLAVEALEPGRIVSTPIQVGRGKVRCAHGVLDIPAPATAAIIARGIPVHAERREGEWCTPTSAALIYHFVDEFEGVSGK